MAAPAPSSSGANVTPRERERGGRERSALSPHDTRKLQPARLEPVMLSHVRKYKYTRVAYMSRQRYSLITFPSVDRSNYIHLTRDR